MAQTFSYKASPSLRSLLPRAPSIIVSPHSTFNQACVLMDPAKKAALVVDNGGLVNWLVFLDLET